MKLKRILCLVAVALMAAPTMNLALAEEGMWPFNNVPRSEIKKRYGFDVTDSWLQKVQLASVRFPNGSGSFVSSDGLVMTNHHIASDSLQKISTPEMDYLKRGFHARTQAEEIKAPDLELNMLVSLEDVTDRVNAAVKPETSPAEAAGARRAATAAIEKESAEKTGLRSEVVTLYQGGQYSLHRYKRFTDVRLVFAPELDIAFFGGDPDNFNFPRYCFDVAFFRVYENDKPLKVEHYFAWSQAGAKENDLVFVTGHPGSTSRLNTVAHLEYLRDYGLPLALKMIAQRLETLRKYSSLGDEQRRRAQEDILSLENTLKAFQGQLDGLRGKSLLAKKREAEASLRRTVAADPTKQKNYGDAWDNIARGRKGLADYFREYSLLENAGGFNSRLFAHARILVRIATEDQKPNSDRLPEYGEARRPILERNLYSAEPIYDDLEKMQLASSLTLLQKELGPNNPVVKNVLKGQSPQARAADLIDGTKLKDVAYRKQLAAGGLKAIAESTDPLILLAKSIDEDAREFRRRYETEVLSNEQNNYPKIARAQFETEGTKLYPDATFTLRLSYGAVKGYQENGKWVAPFTTLGGLFQHATKHGNKDPYQIPQRWAAKKSELNLTTPYNFVTTNDIIGGNSGSPVINRDAALVGLVFDGNIQSLAGNFIYEGSQNRAVAVDSRAIIEALRKVYDATKLADELVK